MSAIRVVLVDEPKRFRAGFRARGRYRFSAVQAPGSRSAHGL
jgi:hypothetical protein